MHFGTGDWLWNRPFSQISHLGDLDLGSGHTAYRRVALIDLYLRTRFCWNQKKICRRTDGQTGFIRSTWRSQPNRLQQCDWPSLIGVHNVIFGLEWPAKFIYATDRSIITNSIHWRAHRISSSERRCVLASRSLYSKSDRALFYFFSPSNRKLQQYPQRTAVIFP